MFKKFASFKYKDIFILCVMVITYAFILFNLSAVSSISKKIGGLLTPFVIGFVIAYLINPVIKFFKDIYFKFFKKPLNNSVAMLISYLVVFLCIIFLLIAIFPQVIASLNIVITEIINLFNKLYRWIDSSSGSSFAIVVENKEFLKELVDKIGQNIRLILSSASNGVLAVFNTTSAIIYTVFSWIFGILISIYMLMHKDMYKAQAKKITFAFLDEEKARKTLDFCANVNDTFSRFINARIIDSLIIGILCWLGCMALRLDNSVLIAFVVGITNIIPYFGPFIGAVPCALISLLQGPIYLIIFLVFILMLQQFDCNILGPKLLGDSLGLTSLWIIFAVAITTSLFGLVGMVIGVPIFAIFYMIARKFVNNRLSDKGLTSDTSKYLEKCSDIKEERS